MLAFRFTTVLRTINLSYLLLTLVCVFLGFSVVVANHDNVNGYVLIAACIAAFIGHPRTRHQDNSSFLVGVIALVASLLYGLFLVITFGLGILPVGIAGLMVLLSYSSIINKHHPQAY